MNFNRLTTKFNDNVLENDNKNRLMSFGKSTIDTKKQISNISILNIPKIN
jgi:hypothetical protein